MKALVPIANLSSLHAEAIKFQRQQNAIYSAPQIEALLCGLVLQSYQALPHHQIGFIAKKIGISIEEEKQGLALLKEVGLVIEKNGKFIATKTAIDTSADLLGSLRIREYWVRRFFGVLSQPGANADKIKSAYSLLSLSSDGERQVNDAYQEFCSKLNEIVGSDFGEKTCVKLCAAQIMNLGV